MRSFAFFIIFLSSVIGGEGCTRQKPAGDMDPITKGKSVYVSNCTACHNMDPRMDGSLGPAVAGASLELLERRILHADYPPGYQPKRTSKAMAALPHLKNEIDALYKYLSSLTGSP
jgi:mono/diheme cytochrome c family protein